MASADPRFADILRSEGFSFDVLREAKLLFEFTPEFRDDYCSNCHVKLVASNGRTYLQAVDYLGMQIVPRLDF